jgi:hypothetical protein
MFEKFFGRKNEEDYSYDITKPEKGLDDYSLEELGTSLDELTKDLGMLESISHKLPADANRIDYLKARINGIKKRLPISPEEEQSEENNEYRTVT